MKTQRIPNQAAPIVFAFVLAITLTMSMTIFMAQASSQATDRYVGTNGNDSGDCTNQASPCRTVDYARMQADPTDTIFIGPGTFHENLNVFVDMDFVGAGEDLTILDGSDVEDRVFTVYFGVESTISDMTIQNGHAPDGSFSGGGLMNLGDLTLDHVVIQNNYASDSGGGIYNEGLVTMTYSTMYNNISDNVAGGIINHGTMVVSESSIFGNKATWITGFGGGVHNNGGATLTMVNVTLSNNTAPAGGAISTGGTVNLTNVTIAENDGTNGFGAAISNYGVVNVKNTVVANNFGGMFCEGTGTVNSMGNNMEDGNSCGFNQGSDFPNTDAKLRGLANYGGPTKTHGLQNGSPAIDGGANSGCPIIDQRGTPRPFDGDGDSSAKCDIGAFEVDPAVDLISLIYLPVMQKK